MKRPLLFILVLSMILPSLFLAAPAGADGGVCDPSGAFSDVPEGAWFRGAVDFVGSRGIMRGSGRSDTFKPQDGTTRAMLAVILHRLEDEPEPDKSSPFSDLTADWYIHAVNWAWDAGVVNGKSETAFDPYGKITRQEIATMIWRYAARKGYPTDRFGVLGSFADGGEVAAWADEAMRWAVGADLIRGRAKGGVDLLAPREFTTRAEIATILMRFILKFEETDAVDPLYEKADALRSAALCEAHGASLHLQFGSPDGLTERAIGACFTEVLGLDPSIYGFTFRDGGYDDFIRAYSRLTDGEGTVVRVSFDIDNLRSAGEPAGADGVPVFVVRNDRAALSRSLGCGEPLVDERLACELEEFSSLFACADHGAVHVEAKELTEASLGGAIAGLFASGPDLYEVTFEDGFRTLKASFDAAAEGGSADADVTFRVSNKTAAESGVGSPGDPVTVRISAVKFAGVPCRTVDCPYADALRALDLFRKKYVCAEHGAVHIAAADVREAEALVGDALDLGEGWSVSLDGESFTAGRIRFSVRADGYRLESESFGLIRDGSAPARFTLCENDRDAYKLIVHDGYDGATGYGPWNGGQTESGWLIDTRADDGVRHGRIRDVSDAEISQVIRPVNDTLKGVIGHRCSVTIEDGFDGAVLDFRNDRDESVCRLETDGGVWKILAPDGSLIPVYEPGGERKFVFDLKIDLIGGTVSVTVNGRDRGTYPLAEAGVNANVKSFRFASTEEDRVSYSMGLCETTVNYSLFEMFSDQYLADGLPAGWRAEGASFSPNDGIAGSWDNHGSDGRLSVCGCAEKSFEPTDGRVIARFSILPSLSGTDASFTVSGGGGALVTVSADDSSFFVNGERAYDYAKNVWYRFYLLCDTATGTVKLKINGIDRGEFSLLGTGAPFDTVRAENRGDDPVLFDEFFVYRDVDHGDYVPEPAIPAGGEDYTVGINTCTMWLNGFHGGWACITPFGDTEPVLGYYDEGSPETADWEIKYLVEHGVDFQSFVSFALEESAPVTTGLSWHLEDGFKLAKYSDMMKYCLNWCSGSAMSPADLESWKTYFVPYLVEHHFKDPRYMVIDNQPLMTFFRFLMPEDNPYWTTENRKAAFGYLEEQVRALGFDGIILLEVDWAQTDANASEGIDGVYSYNFGRGFADTGEFRQITKDETLRQDEKARWNGLEYVPTVSTGFNSIGWLDPRSPVMTAEEFYDCCKWMRDDFFRSDPDEPSWARDLTIISSWNEYGEGTYVMPCDGNCGFGYLDALRGLFTAEAPDDSLNTRPTAAQRERINRLYPQDLKLLRPLEYETYENGVDPAKPKTEAVSEQIATVDPAAAVTAKDDAITVRDGVIVNGSDKRGKVTLSVGDAADLSRCLSVDVLAYIPNRSSCPVYSSGDGGERFCGNLTGNGVIRRYPVYINEKILSGNAIQLRMPPGMKVYGIGISCSPLDYFRHTLTVSGTDIPVRILPDASPHGEYLFAFDTVFTDLHLFGMFAEWNGAAGRLTVSLPGAVFEFTVGSRFYTVNGERRLLGYRIYEKDGVPMIPLDLIAKAAGYRTDLCGFNNAVIEKEGA